MPTRPVTAAIVMGFDHFGTFFIHLNPGKLPSNTSALCDADFAGQRKFRDNHARRWRRWLGGGEEGVELEGGGFLYGSMQISTELH